ncbi:MAG: UPF0149 family protein [Gammaproteobacteria bacterium]|nr:UPF0149 family protein [Gammaproteobacteria bacterium]
MSPIRFALLQDALRRAGARAAAAECHGTLCGIICAGANAEDICFKHLLGGAPDGAACRELLSGLKQEAQQALHNPEVTFAPLLPEDDAPLAGRVEALGEWCQGFLHGLSLGRGRAVLESLPEDAGEVLRDLTEIARAGFDSAEGDEQDEVAYSEIVEYLRVGVQLLFEELNPPPGDHLSAPGLH